MTKTILILSDKFDLHCDKIQDQFLKYNLEYFRLNLDVESLKHTKISLKNEVWYLDNGNNIISSYDIAGILLRRPYVELMLEEYNNTDIGFKIWKNEWNKVLLGFYTSIRNKLWINKLRNAQIAENKFYQYEIAKNCFFNIPSQIVSNDINEIKYFIKNNGECVVKTLAQEFYKDKDNIFKGLYVNKINLDDLKTFHEEENPILLQKYYDKLYEIRYTVVGNEHFACRIDSQLSTKANIDWRRYDIANTPHKILSEIPNNMKDKIDKFMKQLGLSYGALDFIITKNNEWIFLEINSFGQWLWIEDLTGLDISGGFARFFINNL